MKRVVDSDLDSSIVSTGKILNLTLKDLLKLFFHAKCIVKVHRLYSHHHTY